MGRATVTRKDKAYILFNKGYVPSSPDVEALGLSEGSRYTYYSNWQAESQPVPSMGEKIKTKAPAPCLAERQSLPSMKCQLKSQKGVEEKSKGAEEKPKSEKVGVKEVDGKKPPPGRVVGEGLKAIVNVSPECVRKFY